MWGKQWEEKMGRKKAEGKGGGKGNPYTYTAVSWKIIITI